MDNLNAENNSFETGGNVSAVPDSKKDASFIGKIKEKVHVIVPSAVVFICAIAVILLVRNEMSGLNSVARKFECNSNGEEAYIILNENGSYRHHDDIADDESQGKWNESGGIITLTESGSENKEKLYLIDNKYIAFEDENFFKGTVPDGEYFDATFTSEDGTMYSFTSEGKCFTEVDGRNTELDGYITDGNFIIITIDGETHTYLNCGEGISAVYYTNA